ncbi:MAG: Verru_Chthon cassette protein A, partial [Verrucomicrobiia bacterium]
MKTSSRTSAAALVVTLGILVLVLSLVLTFFLAVTSDRTDTAAMAGQWDAQRLAAAVVDLTKSTITQATSGYESNADGSLNRTRRTAWASQPGLIRTWDENGEAYRTYRLYSSGNLSVTGALNLSAEFMELQAWKSGARSLNALWCDLNSPVVGIGGSRSYPIVTPPRDTNSGSVAADPEAGVPTDNPTTSAQEGVQGFAVLQAPGFAPSQDPGASNNPVPMPVRWLYVLQDGSIVTPSGNADLVTVAGASRSNQIVGRIAYWTDDETSKVNINTASEGVFWDIPYGINNEERGTVSPSRLGYSMSVPVSEEFQRQAGHPAFTSLSPVLGAWLPRPAIGFGNQGAASYTGGTYTGNLVPYYRLSPRIASGGTLGGTVPTPAASAIQLQTERLYAAADELLFPPSRNLSSAVVSPDAVAKLPFFVTASSRSPETNLFELPRVGIWPLQRDAVNARNAKDRLIAQAGTLNSHTYFFQRVSTYTNSNSPGSSQSPTLDLAAGSRNERLLLHIRRLLQSNTPGFGQAFAAGKDIDSINRLLVQTFDSIRSLINTTSRSLPPAYSYAPLGPGPNFEQFVNQPATGSVVPIRATAAL